MLAPMPIYDSILPVVIVLAAIGVGVALLLGRR
jgi:hypothetical protein